MRKLISEITPFLAKTPTPKSVSGLDIAAPKKVVAPKTSVKPLATKAPAVDSTAKAQINKRVTFKSSIEPSAKPAEKPFPGTDVAPKPILKSSSSTKKAPTSYEKTSSKPTSSTSRSPQAPSTAPPASSSSSIRRLSAPRGEPNAGGYIRSFITTKDEVYYRVYSEGDVGRFITKVPPKSRALAKEGLALPPSNTATYIQEVHVPAGTRLQRSRALPVSSWSKHGGMEQFQIIEKDIL